MCRNIGAESLGHLFVDEAGQALPQAAVGAIFRSKNVMVVGDPSQIKPVMTLDTAILNMLCNSYNVNEKYLFDSASVQTLVDSASQYGYYREQDRDDDSWIGIPLWVHRRCKYPMFTISNRISYDGMMVQGKPGDGKTGWYDIGGKANNKYVREQGEFVKNKISQLMAENTDIGNKEKKDTIYVISPFKNVAYQLSRELAKIGFTRYDDKKHPTNVGTIHTFQGKEAPIVFMVLGADNQSSGAARWAVSEANMMNVAATRAKEEFYVVGDRKLYMGLDCDASNETYSVIREYKAEHPELVDDTVDITGGEDNTDVHDNMNHIVNKKEGKQQIDENNKATENIVGNKIAEDKAIVSDRHIIGMVGYVGKGSRASYAYVKGEDGKEYSVNEAIFIETKDADEIIQKGRSVSFVPAPATGKGKPLATKIEKAMKIET